MSGKVESVGLYVAVAVALLLLLALTVWLSFVDFGVMNTPVALLIAATKALLVAFFFMHLRHARGLTRLFACTGLLWLAILFTLTLADVMTRGWKF